MNNVATFERRLRLSVCLVLAASAVLTGARAVATPGSGEPACKYWIKKLTYQLNNVNDCETWTECDIGEECAPGQIYTDCGDPGNVDAWCGDFQNGVWNPNTNKCEGGAQVGAYYLNGTVTGFPDPTLCPL